MPARITNTDHGTQVGLQFGGANATTTNLTIAVSVSATSINPIRTVGHIVPTLVRTVAVTVPRSVGHTVPTIVRTVAATIIKSAGLTKFIGVLVSATGGGFPVWNGGAGTDPRLIKQVGHVVPTLVRTATTTQPTRSVGHIVPTITRTVTAVITAIGPGGGVTFTKTIAVGVYVSVKGGFPVWTSYGTDPVLIKQVGKAIATTPVTVIATCARVVTAAVVAVVTAAYPSVFIDRRGSGHQRRDLWFRKKGDK